MEVATDSFPSDEEIKKKIQELVGNIDLSTMRLKGFIEMLSKEFDGVQLKSKKKFIKEALSTAINEGNESDEEEEEHGNKDVDSESGDDDDDDDESEDNSKQKPKGRRGGLAEKKLISDELASLLGQGNKMARTDVVKELWNYIRENDLQNPSNRREILLDDAMQTVFGCETFTMFSMNKYIGAHIHPFKPVDLSSSSPSKAKTSTTRKRKGKSQSGAPKKRKSGTQPPYRLSEALSEVVGHDILPRPQVVKNIWKYIKDHSLQNEDNKKEILCDEKLQKVMGVPKTTMFKMNSLISKHFIEKVDRSEYQHEASSDGGNESDD